MIQQDIDHEYGDLDHTMALEQEIRDLSSKVLLLQRSLQEFHDRFETLFYKVRQQPLNPQDVKQSLQLILHEDSDSVFEESLIAKMAFVEKHLVESQKLQCHYFFMLGLKLKMDYQKNNFVLRDAYEKVLEECVPIAVIYILLIEFNFIGLACLFVEIDDDSRKSRQGYFIMIFMLMYTFINNG